MRVFKNGFESLKLEKLLLFNNLESWLIDYLRVIQSNLKVLNVYLSLDKHNKHIQVSCIRINVYIDSQLSPANSYQELTLLDDNQKPWLVAIRLFVFTF